MVNGLINLNQMEGKILMKVLLIILYVAKIDSKMKSAGGTWWVTFYWPNFPIFPLYTYPTYMQ